MEMIKTTGFCEMSADELQNLDGGIGPTFWIVVGSIACFGLGVWYAWCE